MIYPPCERYPPWYNIGQFRESKSRCSSSLTFLLLRRGGRKNRRKNRSASSVLPGEKWTSRKSESCANRKTRRFVVFVIFNTLPFCSSPRFQGRDQSSILDSRLRGFVLDLHTFNLTDVRWRLIRLYFCEIERVESLPYK